MTRSGRAGICIAAAIAAQMLLLHGQTPARTTSTASVREARISPDGRSIAYVVQDAITGLDGLWRIDFSGGNTRHLSQGGSASNVRWSPDGSQIAYLEQSDGEPSRLWLMPPSGGQLKALGAASMAACEWRPDGREIGCVTADGHLSAIDPVSGRTSAIATGSNTIAAFAWAPNGASIAAIAASPNRPATIVLLNRRRVQYITGAGEAAREIAWSPGASIAWLSGLADAAVVNEVSTTGGPVRRIRGFNGTPLFASWIAISRLSIATRLDADTIIEMLDQRTVRTHLILGPGIVSFATAPSWSRDGARYTISGSGPDHPPEVFAGALPLPLPKGPDTVGAPPPQVRRITFVTER